jgi:DNA-directed RNA polymerase subunit RPC12/RpoP
MAKTKDDCPACSTKIPWGQVRFRGVFNGIGLCPYCGTRLKKGKDAVRGQRNQVLVLLLVVALNTTLMLDWARPAWL